MEVKIETGMNVMDAVLQTAGSLEDYFAFAQKNNIGLTADLNAGLTLKGSGNFYRASTGYVLPVRESKANVIVMPNQTIFDIAMQESGSIEDAFKLAFLNGLSISANLQADATIKTPTVPFDKEVYTDFQNKKLKPASNLNLPGQQNTTGLQGIDYWAIEIDFKVS